ncbi:alanyl-tRNA synthetase, partial [Haematococcus lacustris]
GRLLGIRDVFTPQVAEVAVSLSGPCDPQLATNAPRIYDVLRQGVMQSVMSGVTQV